MRLQVAILVQLELLHLRVLVARPATQHELDISHREAPVCFVISELNRALAVQRQSHDEVGGVLVAAGEFAGRPFELGCANTSLQIRELEEALPLRGSGALLEPQAVLATALPLVCVLFAVAAPPVVLLTADEAQEEAAIVRIFCDFEIEVLRAPDVRFRGAAPCQQRAAKESRSNRQHQGQHQLPMRGTRGRPCLRSLEQQVVHIRVRLLQRHGASTEHRRR
mmetsp:Transcript_40209/g.93471  ORF Transcript_40209/g.93471 Transcript_40209/m.93471 type:complete len:223 (-) Transcript_40209:8-676(-)